MIEFAPDRVYMRDVRAAKMCAHGVKEFCVRHGLNWRELLLNGLRLQDVESTGDAMAMRVVEYVRNGRQL